ncbi:MAG: SDR family oxidoreductase [Sphingomonadales bacterium]|nr:MAG: SDR family oxidoreductase [Sphingomonadales bacterium]
MRFAGRAAIVTGAGSGIGRAAAMRLASEGANVVLVGRNAARLDESLAMLRGEGAEAIAVAVDLSEERAPKTVVDACIAAFGRLDVLVNNAAVGRNYDAVEPGTMRPLHETTREAWGRVLDINLTATAFLIREALPHLKASGKGAIVTLASILGFRGDLTDHAYTATKAAIINLTRSVAITYGAQNVRANCIAPGLIDTEMSAATMGASFMQSETGRFRVSALGRAGKPEEIASIIAFLASDDASFVSGAMLVADGGLTARVR